MIDTEYLDEKSNNYLMGIVLKKNKIGIAYIDITTGQFIVSDIDKNDEYIPKLLSEINKIAPKEIVIDENAYEILKEKLMQFPQFQKININPYTIVRKSEEFLKIILM